MCLRFLPPCLLLPHFLCLCLTAGVFLKNNKVWGRACACVFCAGLTDWMGWLHWAGFLCGPPANFMIYSAKGRGARPPVTTERELHVGLMISPQKCLLWLGLRGAQSPPARVPEWWRGGSRRRECGGGAFEKKSSADWTESMQKLTITHLCVCVGGGGYGEGEDKQKVTSDCHVPNVLHPLSFCMRVIMLPYFPYIPIFLSPPYPPSPPPAGLVASGRFQRHR